jgi:hypothetical protein
MVRNPREARQASLQILMQQLVRILHMSAFEAFGCAADWIGTIKRLQTATETNACRQ